MNAYMNEQVRLKLAEMSAEAPDDALPTPETMTIASERRSPVRQMLAGLALRLRPAPAWTMAPDAAEVRRRLAESE